VTRCLSCIFVVCMFWAQIGSAQLRFGLHGGTHTASFVEPDKWEWRTRGYGGLVCDFELSDHLLLIAQINYIEKWTGRDGLLWAYTTSDIFHTTLEHKYLEMPVYVRWRPGHSDVRWFCECGPTIGRLISAKAQLWSLSSGTWMEDLSGLFVRSDVTLSLGTGLEINPAPSMCVIVSAHYAYGLIDMSIDEMGTKTQGIQADVGLMYRP
jgi:hypothetical protein